jgi:predicted nucleotidyltransferase
MKKTQNLKNIQKYAQEIVLSHPLLKESQTKLGIVLAGSRSVGYDVPSSDYDFLAVCEGETFKEIAKLAGKKQDIKGIDIPLDKDSVKRKFGIEVDIAVYNTNRIAQAFKEYKDIVIWIWTNATIVVDPSGCVSALQKSFKGYPRDVLEPKLKKHFLNDFHLSVHGITYRYESQNIFSVVYTLASKVAEFCRLCCLLDESHFPYEKWLLKECEKTTTGQKISSLLEKVINSVTRLEGDLEKNSGLVEKAVYVLDTEVCDIVENTLVSWGIERKWVENAYGCLEDVIFE